MRTKRRLARVILVLLGMSALLGSSVVMASPALAVGCYGDYCSGKDPQATGCSSGAYTVEAVPLYEWRLNYVGSPDGYWKRVGTLELRWSPTCKTNWARASMSDSTAIQSLYVTQETGYQQGHRMAGWWGGSSPGNYYTPMIYSPVLRCRAHTSGGNIKQDSTGWW